MPPRTPSLALVLLALASLPALPQGGEGPAPEPERPVGEDAVRVAFLLGPEAWVMDFAGPWEVFQNVHLPGYDHDEMEHAMPFRLYTVAESTTPIVASGGLTIVPDYGFAEAPEPDIVVVPAQAYRDRSPAVFAWLRDASRTADLVLSVCNGSFLLAEAGLLAGREATAAPAALDLLARQFPDVTVRRDVRFVESPGIATASSGVAGIELALRAVARRFGPEVARQVARGMQYPDDSWLDGLSAAPGAGP